MNQEATQKLIDTLVAEARRDPALLPLAAQKEELGQGRSSIYAYEAAGLLPPAIKLNARVARRPRGEVRAMARARTAGLPEDAQRELVRRLVAARTEVPA